jgi:hypothetical protein
MYFRKILGLQQKIIKKLETWLQSDRTIGHFTRIPRKIFTVDCSMTCFVAQQQCKGKASFRFHGNTKQFWLLVDICRSPIRTKESVAFPWQQSLIETATMLREIYIVSLSVPFVLCTAISIEIPSLLKKNLKMEAASSSKKFYYLSTTLHSTTPWYSCLPP